MAVMSEDILSVEPLPRKMLPCLWCKVDRQVEAGFCCREHAHLYFVRAFTNISGKVWDSAETLTHLMEDESSDEKLRMSGNLGEEKLAEIRRMIAEGMRQVDIAEVTGLSQNTVSRVKRGVYDEVEGAGGNGS